jgi:DNA-binding transcriptional LysR family regulator
MKNINDTLAKCRRMGFSPRELEFVPNFHTLLHNIREGRGMGICGRFNYLVYDDIKYYPLPDSESQYVLVTWRTDRLSTEARDFIRLLSDESLVLAE